MNSSNTDQGSETSTVRGFANRASNRMLHLLARFLPGATSLRPWLHRLRGVKIAERVFIGDEVYLDNEFPEAIELREGALIGLRSTIVAHTRGPGRVVVGKNAVIGAGTLITCAAGQTLEIGEGAVVGAGSVVANSIPSFTLCGSPRARALATVTVPFTLDTSYQEFLRGLRPLTKSFRTRPNFESTADRGSESGDGTWNS
jgi:serine acetyltransferase